MNQIECCGLLQGEISSIFIPCQFNGRNPLVLAMECTIQSLCVAFYFPMIYENDEMKPGYVRIEWEDREHLSKYDKKVNIITLY